MKFLEIEEYNKAEKNAILKLSYPPLRAFQPAAFKQVNFPSYVSCEDELVRYCDILHELEDFEKYYYNDKYSEDEVDLIKNTRAKIEDLTRSHFRHVVQPLMGIFSSIHLFRSIKKISDNLTPNCRVLEIGPGSGILGAFLILSKITYLSMDCTQAFYLWQNRLFSYLSSGNYIDFSQKSSFSETITKTIQVPWWHFSQMYKDCIPACDVIVCEAALGEMEHFAIWYNIKIAKKILASSRVGIFMYTHVGEQRIGSESYIDIIFRETGFTKNVVDGITIQELHDNKISNKIKSIQDSHKRFTASNFMQIDLSKLSDTYSFMHFLEMNKKLTFMN